MLACAHAFARVRVCCVLCTRVQGIWVSRPASYNPLISFLNEAVMTFIFLFLVSLMTAR